MSSIIKSVSLDNSEDEFLKDYNLSPTQLLKEKIWEMRGMIKKVVQDKIMRQGAAIERLSAHIDKLTDVLEKNEIDIPELY